MSCPKAPYEIGCHFASKIEIEDSGVRSFPSDQLLGLLDRGDGPNRLAARIAHCASEILGQDEFVLKDQDSYTVKRRRSARQGYGPNLSARNSCWNAHPLYSLLDLQASSNGREGRARKEALVTFRAYKEGHPQAMRLRGPRWKAV